MGKVFAISSTGKTEKSLLDLRFGKCESVVIYYAEKNQYSIIENPFKDGDDSGIKLVAHLKKEGVSTIITGEVGPKVSAMLEKEKLQLVLLPEERIKIEDIMDRIKL
jgi:predicted Fe-Mo cluster-binding NifX family protein